MDGLALLAGLLLVPMLVFAPFRRQSARLAGGAVAWTARRSGKVAWWAIKLPFRSLRGMAMTSLALAGEEFKRWIGLMTGGMLLAALTWVTVKLFAGLPLLVLLVLLIDLGWVWAVFRGAHRTAANRLAAVRAREMYRKLDKVIAQLPGRLEGAAPAVRARTTDWFQRDNPPAGFAAAPDDESAQAQLRWEKEREAAASDAGWEPARFEPVVWLPKWMRRGRGRPR